MPLSELAPHHPAWTLSPALVTAGLLAIHVTTLSYHHRVLRNVVRSGENHGALQWARTHVAKSWVLLSAQVVNLVGAYPLTWTNLVAWFAVGAMLATGAWLNVAACKRLRERSTENATQAAKTSRAEG